ncbi:sterol acyltransferase KNAG_0D00500 [Huiozyma naganishii CBS 8797]|uniref:O-acyltransferase n=1 Tax=Huiozyma naganishii (strain ATCC MYA-139 / BCRC 22969 / CBS 8797 / KCTC 17520 / NBRC 10181 / NCYC 3082 / Yp74L-3) TaxID=1071383 RepID=J7RXJ0_HUIN7|nr:hypothetical protein KNAG_0D00500 [Kazachstania naganishii CBS 8797]CCK69802.1 hypothetical protein KNAG_0D00500 [Kazachstania naganishii CBS 8797]
MAVTERSSITDDLGDDEVQATRAASAASVDDESTNPPNDAHLQRHIAVLKDKIAARYRQGKKQRKGDGDGDSSPAFISYFDDVDFHIRSSILDGSITEPFQLHFKGPTLEAEIKTRERARRQLIRENILSRKLSGGGDDRDGDDAQEQLQKEVPFDNSPLPTSFSGLYVATWMAVGLSVVKFVLDYYWDSHHRFMQWEVVDTMTTGLFRVAAMDAAMYLATYVVFSVQWLCKHRVLKWYNAGWWIVALYEPLFVVAFIYINDQVLEFHWIARIFLFLHSLVLLMKMHSFAFYNGYLWSIHNELQEDRASLARLQDIAAVSDDKAIETTRSTLNKSLEFCRFELESQSIGGVSFPQTITVKNYFMFTMFPTLVYQSEYPRTEKIRWHYVVEKLFAIFGTIFVMIVTAQVFMYPVVLRCTAVRESQWTSWFERLVTWSGLLVDILPSFIAIYLLDFYLIWDAILNCIAELTMFGDRYFYGDWWNCVTWDEFSRIWNVPVYKFLLRHVYHSSISTLKLSKQQATFMTFFISSVVHEMAMYVIFKRLRFYLFCFQMLQLPLVAISNCAFFRGKPIIGNVIFWIGICIGPGLMCTLYLTI